MPLSTQRRVPIGKEEFESGFWSIASSSSLSSKMRTMSGTISPSFLYGIVTIGFAIGQYSFAREVGPDLGFFYGGVLCQTLASLGPIAQILSRNSTRGASLLTW